MMEWAIDLIEKSSRKKAERQGESNSRKNKKIKHLRVSTMHAVATMAAEPNAAVEVGPCGRRSHFRSVNKVKTYSKHFYD